MFDKSKIGQSFPPFTVEVERGKIRELALAIGARWIFSPLKHATPTSTVNQC